VKLLYTGAAAKEEKREEKKEEKKEAK